MFIYFLCLSIRNILVATTPDQPATVSPAMTTELLGFVFSKIPCRQPTISASILSVCIFRTSCFLRRFIAPTSYCLYIHDCLEMVNNKQL